MAVNNKDIHFTIKQEAFDETDETVPADETENLHTLPYLLKRVNEEAFDVLETEKDSVVADNGVMPVKKEESYEIEFYEEPADHACNSKLIVSPKEQRSHQCEDCGKCFLTNTHLVRHLRVHTGEKPFKCKECGREFSYKHTHMGHNCPAQTGDNPFECEDCGKKFSENRRLKRHRLFVHKNKTHDNSTFTNLTKQLPNQCTTCGKCFTKNAYLVQHVRSHTGEKPFECGECGKPFSQKCNLEEHKQKICSKNNYTASLTEQRPHRCKDCGKSFLKNAHLVQHMRVHTGEKPFKCDECGKAFARKGSLEEHKLFVHTEGKSCGKKFENCADGLAEKRTHQCKDCGKFFSMKSSLVRHIRIHTGEKPFDCDSCGKKFSQKGNLQLHKASVHKDGERYG